MNMDEPQKITLERSEQYSKVVEALIFEIKKVIVGQDHMLERLLIALLSQGHILLEGLPGLAKTLTISTLAQNIGASFVRFQFTPDLLPSDLLGTRIWKTNTEQFDIDWGPIFANFVLADEINRAPAKVQSALLEVMAEKQVSIGGQTRKLPQPFLVLATQNPIESEGVYNLPEAQQDRFMMKVLVDHPKKAEELEIINRMTHEHPEPKQVLTIEQLSEIQQAAKKIYVDAAVNNYAVDLVMATREPMKYDIPEIEPLIEYGVSPRATLALISGAKSLSLMRGRNYATPQEVFDVARDVMRHRLILSYDGLAKGTTADDIINRILTVVPAADITPKKVPASPIH